MNALRLKRRESSAVSAPVKIARAVEKDAEKSPRRKSTPYRSAMSRLPFYINRGGKNLTAKHRKVLEEAKDVLREQFGPQTAAPAKKKTATNKKSAAKKSAKTKSGAKRSGAKKSGAKKAT